MAKQELPNVEALEQSEIDGRVEVHWHESDGKLVPWGQGVVKSALKPGIVGRELLDNSDFYRGSPGRVAARPRAVATKPKARAAKKRAPQKRVPESAPAVESGVVPRRKLE